jgi:hypothetical protein
MLEVCVLNWHISPLRDQRWLDAWIPAAEKCTAYGAKSWTLIRDNDDPLSFQQTMIWENRSDFERYWFSQEIAEARESVIKWYDIPLIPAWHALIGADSTTAALA